MQTIFNLLGPLTNPAGAPFQLLGVARPELRETLARALALLGTQRTVVVSAEGNLGEVTVAGATSATEIAATGNLKEHRWTAADFGLTDAYSLAPLAIENAEQSAAIIRKVLGGEPGPARDIVVANAAAALWVAGRVASLREGAKLAQQALDRRRRRGTAGPPGRNDERQAMNGHSIHTRKVLPPTAKVRDPVCGMMIDPATAAGKFDYQGQTYYFCNPGCLKKFQANPAAYLSGHASPPVVSISSIPHSPLPIPHSSTYTCPMHPEIVQNGPGTCPICGMALEPQTITADESPNVELVDMSRRFWICLAFTLPIFILAMTEMIPGNPLDALDHADLTPLDPIRLAPRSSCSSAGQSSSAAGNRSSTARPTCSHSSPSAPAPPTASA